MSINFTVIGILELVAEDVPQLFAEQLDDTVLGLLFDLADGGHHTSR